MSWLSHAVCPYTRRRSRKNIWMIKSTADPGRSTRAMCYRVILVSFLWSLWLIPQTVRAQTLYWDNTNVGVPGGTWDSVSPNWNTDPAGSPAQLPTNWVQTNNAVFSASNLATTSSFNVTLSEDVTVGNLTYTGSGTQLSISVGLGDTITMANPQMDVNVVPATQISVSPTIAGTGRLVIQSGAMVLLGANTYTGGTTINAGSFLQLGGGTHPEALWET